MGNLLNYKIIRDEQRELLKYHILKHDELFKKQSKDELLTKYMQDLNKFNEQKQTQENEIINK